MTETLIIFFTALVATALSSMSGGGASAINIPVLLWLGVPFPVATLAQKTSSAFWTPPAAYNYLRDRKVDWLFLIIFSALGIAGVYYGTLFITSIDERIIQKVVGAIILCLVMFVVTKRNTGLSEEKIYSRVRRSLSYIFAPILGFYEGIFGAGNGILFPIVTFYTRGFDFIDALGSYYVVSFTWVTFAAILLAVKGYWVTAIIVPTIIGSVIGGYIGSRYAKYKGNKFIRMMFAIVGTLLAVKLFTGV